jgi:hypothetical protein
MDGDLALPLLHPTEKFFHHLRRMELLDHVQYLESPPDMPETRNAWTMASVRSLVVTVSGACLRTAMRTIESPEANASLMAARERGVSNLSNASMSRQSRPFLSIRRSSISFRSCGEAFSTASRSYPIPSCHFSWSMTMLRTKRARGFSAFGECPRLLRPA